ncbi:hypothetical protein MRB53_001948 [Persea americana]|uniref:Uncharacterized protein n=1 Tax=Persea americana TaxID=3435 RepID=A0ACC2MT67_PERAE|nr:hypothetical protein MRB53_001948 [Persea americana]
MWSSVPFSLSTGFRSEVQCCSGVLCWLYSAVVHRSWPLHAAVLAGCCTAINCCRWPAVAAGYGPVDGRSTHSQVRQGKGGIVAGGVAAACCVIRQLATAWLDLVKLWPLEIMGEFWPLGNSRAGPQSHHQVNPDEDEDPRLDEVRAQNRLIQEQDELILRLLFQEKRGARSPPHGCSHASGPPPKHNQAPPGHRRDLRHVLDSKRRDRVHREENSSSSHEHVEPKKQRRIPEDKEELKQWIDQQVKQTVRQNMEIAGITRDQCSAFEAEDTGASPFSMEIRKYSLPEKFNVSRFTLYDGTSDPVAHLRHYIQRMSVWGDDDFLNCRVFSSSLGDLPLRWFCSLPGGSISSW